VLRDFLMLEVIRHKLPRSRWTQPPHSDLESGRWKLPFRYFPAIRFLIAFQSIS
jgi:hypothetical protein